MSGVRLSGHHARSFVRVYRLDEHCDAADGLPARTP
jgi:hypothetical protein